MKPTALFFLLIVTASCLQAQEVLTSSILEKSAIRFSLDRNHKLDDGTKRILSEMIGSNQFVGIAEVHNSPQLSKFMVGFLELLKEKEFEHFALEMGAHSAKILQEISKSPGQVSQEIKKLNQTYGKKQGFNIPLVFVANESDALFVEKAANLGFRFWGLDQEYAGSFEMHIDQLYQIQESPSSNFEQDYQAAKASIHKYIFKNKVKGQSVFCWYQTNETIAKYFSHFEGNEVASKIIEDLQVSWDIYCKSATGKGSNQQRADYMKKNFEQYYNDALQQNSSPKVLVKLGGVHLTHGLSPFGVDDIGKFLHEKSSSNNTEFLTIRHLIAYKNGKSNIGRSGWKNVEMFLELGLKDQWTLVDLRPIRAKVLSNELTTTNRNKYELMSYDLLLIPPNDSGSKINY